MVHWIQIATNLSSDGAGAVGVTNVTVVKKNVHH